MISSLFETMHPGPYICAMYYIISTNFSPVANHTSKRFTFILTDKIMMASHMHVILNNYYKTVFVMVQDAS